MTTETSEKLYTVEEFLNLEWPDDDENEYELIGGRIVANLQGSSSGFYGDVSGRICTEFNNFAGSTAGEKRTGTAFVGSSTTLGQPQGKNNPKPDVCFVLKGRAPENFSGPIPVAPDIVVEVNSPSDTDERRFEKLQAYQQAGVALIWSVHLLEKFVVVYSKNELYPRFFTLNDELDGSDVLPGFKLKVRALFD